MKFVKGLSMLLLASIAFVGCSDDDEVLNEPVGIKSMAIINAGEGQNTRVEGVLNGDQFDFTVSPLSNVGALKLEIVSNLGTTTTPVSGSTLDFTVNDGVQTIIASKGTETKIYKAKVTPSAFTTELALLGVDVSGVSFPVVAISHVEKTIHLTFADVTGKKAVLSNFQLNPASAVIKASVPAMEEDAEGNPFMTIDFTVQGEKSITLQNGANEVKYVISATINKAGFDVSTEKVVLDQILGSNLNPILGKNTTRGSYFDGRYAFFACREGGNNIYYYDITDATKEIKSLKLGENIVTGGAWAVSDIRVAANGNIYVSNMVNAKAARFKVYRWDNVADETPEVVLDYEIVDPVAPSTAVRLGDALSIIGDPKTNGEIIASNFPFNNTQQGQLYVWKFQNGQLVAGSPQVVELVGTYAGPSGTDKSLGQYARVAAVPGSNNYLVTGSAVSALIYDNSWNKVFEMTRDMPIQGRAMDMNLFEYNGVRYMAYTVNREWAANDAFVEIVALTEGNNFVEGLQALSEKSMDDIRAFKKQITTNATKGAAWVNANSSVKIVNDKVYVFGFVVEYGAVVFEFSK